MFIYYKIELYPRIAGGQGGWKNEATIITDHFNHRVKKAIGNKKDVFSFNLNNANNPYFGNTDIFENGDLIKIYAKVNSKSVSSSDMLISGTILNVQSTIGDNTTLRIEGKGRTEQLLEGLCFISSTSELTPAEILEQSLDFHNNNNENYQITWSDTNPSTKSDGSSFPTYQVADFYKPMNYVFERYSGRSYTEDGNYYYYVNDDNEMIWKRQENESSYTLQEQECNKINAQSKASKIVNSLVLRVGTDLYGNGISTIKFDYSSRAKNGAKWKIITSTNDILSSLGSREITTNNSDFEEGSRFPKSESYPYTTTFGETVSDDEDYNDKLKTEAKRLGKIAGSDYLSNLREEHIVCKVWLPFTKDYGLGNVIECNFPHYGLQNKNLRITNITYTDEDTIISLEEDYGIK